MPRSRLAALLDDEVVRSEPYRTAITHRSAGGQRHNERLEFLGDAVLGMVIAEHLYHHRPEASEGVLSRLRAHLVRKETLAAIAHDQALGQQLVLGQGELKSGGHRRDTILADALEAVLGAVYVVKGLAFTRWLILELLAEPLARLPSAEALKDPKTRLQELLQAPGLALPSYDHVHTEGQAHAQSFSVRCRIDSHEIDTLGTGATKRKAEQVAAEHALEAFLDSDGR